MLRANPSLETILILCSILTLESQNPFFREQRINNKLYFTSLSPNLPYIIINLSKVELSKEFYDLVNQKSLRQFAYTIIQPLIFRTLQPDYKIIQQNKRLKKYLKKFRHLYKRYFSSLNFNKNGVKNDKDINCLAIQTLFLIVGI